MPNESAGGPPPPLPPLPADLAADFDAFRLALDTTPALSALAARPSVLDSWREYGRLLHDRAADLALIAKGDRAQVFTRHILDSLNPLSAFDAPPESALDVGSGGGLPGIPIAIAWPETRVVLLESRERKAGFLEQAVRLLGLRNVRVVCARLEDYGAGWSVEPVTLVVVRALGELAEVLQRAEPACAAGAGWVYFLGSRPAGDVLRDGAHAAGAEVVTGAFGGRLLVGRFARR